MIADGSLVNSGGHMEQIVRCDVGSGYFLNVGFQQVAQNILL